MDESNPAAQTTEQPPSKVASEAEMAAYYEQYQQYSQQCYPYYQQYGYNGYDINSDEYRQYYAQYQQQQQLLTTQQQQQPQTASSTDDAARMTTAAVACPDNNQTDVPEQKVPAKTPQTAVDGDDNDSVSVSNNSTLLTNAPATRPLREWSHVEVSEWVRSVQDGAFAEYAPSFAQNEIDGRVLSTMTEQQLQRGLYMNNMMQRLQFHDLIQQLKQPPSPSHAPAHAQPPALNDTMASPAMIAVANLERAPPLKKKRRRNKPASASASAHELQHEDMHAHKYRQSTAAFLKQANRGKSSSQLLVEKMSMNSHSHGNKRSLQQMEQDDVEVKEAGELVEVDWRYNEHESYRDLYVHVHDRVLFKWEFTKNVWQFSNKNAFAENDFRTTVAEELCGCECQDFQWTAKKAGVFYFGCQVAECAKSGNMKIRIRVSQRDDDSNNKKQRIE